MAGDWGIIIATGIASAVLVAAFIWVIELWGEKGQALSWLPIGLLTTVFVQHISDRSKMDDVVNAAIAAQFISASFIITFHRLLKSEDDTCTSCAPGTKLTLWLTGVLIVSTTIVWTVTLPDLLIYPFVTGVIGTGATILYIHFSDIGINFDTNACCDNKQKKCCQDPLILIVAAVATFLFVLFPAWLASIGFHKWSGIFANMPKTIIVVMAVLWYQYKDDPERNAHMESHLVMFAYSTCIAGLFLFIFAYDEDNFWLSLCVGIILVLITIFSILWPLCCGCPKKGRKSGQVGVFPPDGDDTYDQYDVSKVELLKGSQSGDPKLKF